MPNHANTNHDTTAAHPASPSERRRLAARHVAAVHQISTSGQRDLRAAIERLDREHSSDELRRELAFAGLL